MASVNHFRDLRVYRKLVELHLAVHRITTGFPQFERFELGAQVRRSSNSAPANLAEGWGSRHTNMYMASLNRSMGEVRETQHHLDMAHRKGYIDDDTHAGLEDGYDHCGRMLERLSQSLSTWRGSRRDGSTVGEDPEPYGPPPTDAWAAAVEVTCDVMATFADDRQPTTDNRGI